MLIIMFIKPKADDCKEEDMLYKYRKELGEDCIVAFAIGCPGVRDEDKAVKYKVNKIFQQLNIEGEEPEEEDDYE